MFFCCCCWKNVAEMITWPPSLKPVMSDFRRSPQSLFRKFGQKSRSKIDKFHHEFYVFLCSISLVNYGMLLLQALFEHWPETHCLPETERGNKENSGKTTELHINLKYNKTSDLYIYIWSAARPLSSIYIWSVETPLSSI